MTEQADLEHALGDEVVARTLVSASAGWRTLSVQELERLGLGADQRRTVVALQKLVSRSWAPLPLHECAGPDDVGRLYAERLGALVHEVMIAIALDGRSRVVAEIELARGGRHGLSLTPADVLRPLIRVGASSYILLHNHPSGDPTPSVCDLEMTHALVAVSDIVGVALVDHVVIGGKGGGYASMLELGVIGTEQSARERRANELNEAGRTVR